MTAKTKRALAFPRAYSIMIGLLTGKVVDVLRVLVSTKTYRASGADVTRDLILKGMAVTAVEHATTYALGRPVDLVTDLVDQVCVTMGKEFTAGLPGHGPDEVLQAVLSRMWPDVVQAMERVDVRTKTGQAKHRKLLAGPPLTRMGRPQTSREIRAQALADIVSGQVEAPKFLPPRDVQEARAQARQQTRADRLAVERGVPVRDLLAGTPGGREAGMTPGDESAAALGYTKDAEKPSGGPHTRAGAAEAEQPSLGEMLKQARGER